MTRRGKKRLLVLVSVAAVVGALATTGYFVREARRSQQLADAYRDGMAAYDAGDFENALRGLGKSLAEHRDDSEVLYRIAESRRRVPMEDNRHFAAAIPYAREAAIRNPNDERPLELLLVLYWRVGFVTERLEVANRLLALDPKHSEAQMAKIECLNALGRTAETRKAIEDLIVAHPKDVRGHEMLVEMMRLEGKPSNEVLEHVSSLVRRWPEEIAFATLEARTLAALGRRDEALEVAKRAASLDIANTDVLFDLVQTLDLLGQRGTADKLLDRAVADERFRDDVFAYLIERAWKAGQVDRARQLASQQVDSLAETPSKLLGWMTLALLPAEKGWASTDPGQQLAARSGNDAQYWKGLLESRELIDSRQYSGALKRLSPLVTSEEADSLVWSFLGEASQRIGEPDMAISSLEQAVRIDPTASRAQMMLATSLLDFGRLEEAQRAAERAVMINPGAPEALTLTRVYIAILDTGRGDARIESGAVSIVEELSSQAPDQPDLEALLARTYVAVGHLQEAKAVVERMTKAERLPASAVLLDLVNACKQRAPDLVAPLLSLAARLDQGGPGLMAMRINNRADELTAEEVRAEYQAAIKDATDSIQRMQYEIAFARYLDSTGDSEALSAFIHIAETYPDQPEAQGALLDSRIAWSDQSCIVDAIARLKSVTGENASRWRLAEAQRRLAFEPGDESASAVVLMLAPLTQGSFPNVKAMMLTSDAMLMLGDRDGAIQMLQRAIDQQPKNALLFAQTIDLLQSAGRSTEASGRLREFLAIGTLNPSLQRRRIDLLDRQDMWIEAIRDCEALLSTTGDSNDRLRLAILYSRHGRTEDARRLFGQLLAEPSVAPATRVAAANFFAAADGLDRGLAVIQPMKGVLDATEYTRILVAFYERHNRVDDAGALLEKRAENSSSADDWASLVEFQIRNQRIEQARQSIDRGLAVTSDHEALLALRSLLVSLESGRLGSESIQGILNALVDESLRPAMTRLAEAMQYYEANPDDLTGYIRQLRKAVDSEPALILGWQLLTTALLSNGQASEAVVAAQSAARILPTSVRAAELLAATLADANRFDEARVAVMRWRELDPERLSRADLLLAQIERQRGRPAQALTAIAPWIERIEVEADKYPTRLGLYASILIQVGRIDEAHELIWPRAEKSADWAQAYIRLASEITQSPETAIQWVDRAEPLVPLTLDTRAGLAQVRIALGQQSARTDQFEQALALLEPITSDPKTPGAILAMLASCYQQLGQAAKAEKAYRSALMASPDDPIIMNNLAYLLLQADGRGQEALDLAKRAIAGAQQRRLPATIRANLMDTLGTAQVKLAQLSEAQDTFRQGLSLDPGSAMLRLGLAEALAKNGRIEDARSEYRQVASRGDLNWNDSDLETRRDEVARLLN